MFNPGLKSCEKNIWRKQFFYDRFVVVGEIKMLQALSAAGSRDIILYKYKYIFAN